MPRRPNYPRICVALGLEDRKSLLQHAREEADEGCRFLEFRLDYLKRPAQGIEVIRSLLSEYPDCLITATCRHEDNQGRFRGTVDEQIGLLEAAVEAGARSVDLEIEHAEKASLGKLREKADLVVSYHNFSRTPVLEPVLRRLSRIPAAVYKIATMAQKPSDNQRVLSAARARSRTPLVALAMGEVGLPSRVIAPTYGGLYTYAAPCSAAGTAPGQPTARQLRHLYNIDKLTRTTKIFGVIADPVGHSISPAVHNRAFQCRRIDSVYLPFRVEAKRLKDFFSLAANLPVAGFSVTIPHKQKVLRYLDIIDPLARRIGAVNTVWKKAGKWRGANTDAEGVTAPLAKHLRLAKSSVLVVGNGGGARAAAFALADKGAKVALTGRRFDRVRALARISGAEAITREDLAGRHFDALIHATPVGMHPHRDECFFADSLPADVVFDMVYNPLETTLLKRARQQKKTVIPGIRMFLEQAARQFEIWTGGSAPRSVMERAANDALKTDS